MFLSMLKPGYAVLAVASEIAPGFISDIEATSSSELQPGTCSLFRLLYTVANSTISG
jgi:hypothetical protein